MTHPGSKILEERAELKRLRMLVAEFGAEIRARLLRVQGSGRKAETRAIADEWRRACEAAGIRWLDRRPPE